MRGFTVSSVVTVLAIVFFMPINAMASQSVVISEPFVNVYERLDPKSNVLKLVKKGDRLDIIYAGPMWYQVKLGNTEGWVERKAGNVVEGTNILSTVISTLIILVIMGGTLTVVLMRINKQKTA